MSPEEGNRRKYSPQSELLNGVDLVAEKFPCPFTAAELNLLRALRDGFDSEKNIASELRIGYLTFKKRKRDIAEKVQSIYRGAGNDNLAKALSLSILGNWIEQPEYSTRQTELEPLERELLSRRCFGCSVAEVMNEFHIKAEEYNEKFLNMKKGLGLAGDYQVIAWAASQARVHLLKTKRVNVEAESS